VPITELGSIRCNEMTGNKILLLALGIALLTLNSERREAATTSISGQTTMHFVDMHAAASQRSESQAADEKWRARLESNQQPRYLVNAPTCDTDLRACPR